MSRQIPSSYTPFDGVRDLCVGRRVTKSKVEDESIPHVRKSAKSNHMLFVDDEPCIRLTLAPILEESGFQGSVLQTASPQL